MDQVEYIKECTGIIYFDELGLSDLENERNSYALDDEGNIVGLNLNGHELTDICFITKLTSLCWLSFDNNQISDLSPLQGLTQLEFLSFDNNQVSNLSPLQGLTKLVSLFLTKNQVADLSQIRPLLELPHLQELYAFGNPFYNTLIEIVGDSRTWKSLASLRQYLKQLDSQGTIKLYEAKMVLVGEAGTGKTTLRKKLVDPAYPVPNPEDEKNSTHGIEITPAIAFDHAPQPILANIWDFGGQHNYYSTHRYFLTEWALYVLVVDERKENTRFDYWFQILDLLAKDKKSDKKLPVVLLYNKRSGQPMKYLDLHDYEARFPAFKIDRIELDFSESDWGSNRLRALLSAKLALLDHIGKEVPALWLPIRKELERRRVEEKADYIDRSVFFDICRQKGLMKEDEQLFLSSFLHQIGVILHYQDGSDALARTIILNPDWAVDAVYAALSDREKVKEGCFKFRKQWLIDFWKQKGYRLDEYEAFLNLMFKNRFEIAYQHTDKAGETWVTAPELLSAIRPQYAFEQTGQLVFRYEYEFMPEGLLTHFIVRMSDLIWEVEGEQMVWKNGVVLDNRKGAQAEIRRLDLEGNRKIRFEIRIIGDKKESFLEEIRKEFEGINFRFSANLKPTELLPCACEPCQQKTVPEFVKLLQLQGYKNKNINLYRCNESLEEFTVIDLLKQYDKESSHDIWLEERSVLAAKLDHAEREKKALEAALDSKGHLLEATLLNSIKDNIQKYEIRKYYDAAIVFYPNTENLCNNFLIQNSLTPNSFSGLNTKAKKLFEIHVIDADTCKILEITFSRNQLLHGNYVPTDENLCKSICQSSMDSLARLILYLQEAIATIL